MALGIGEKREVFNRDLSQEIEDGEIKLRTHFTRPRSGKNLTSRHHKIVTNLCTAKYKELTRHARVKDMIIIIISAHGIANNKGIFLTLKNGYQITPLLKFMHEAKQLIEIKCPDAIIFNTCEMYRSRTVKYIKLIWEKTRVTRTCTLILNKTAMTNSLTIETIRTINTTYRNNPLEHEVIVIVAIILINERIKQALLLEKKYPKKPCLWDPEISKFYNVKNQLNIVVGLLCSEKDEFNIIKKGLITQITEIVTANLILNSKNNAKIRNIFKHIQFISKVYKNHPQESPGTMDDKPPKKIETIIIPEPNRLEDAEIDWSLEVPVKKKHQKICTTPTETEPNAEEGKNKKNPIAMMSAPDLIPTYQVNKPNLPSDSESHAQKKPNITEPLDYIKKENVQQQNYASFALYAYLKDYFATENEDTVICTDDEIENLAHDFRKRLITDCEEINNLLIKPLFTVIDNPKVVRTNIEILCDEAGLGKKVRVIQKEQVSRGSDIFTTRKITPLNEKYVTKNRNLFRAQKIEENPLESNESELRKRLKITAEHHKPKPIKYKYDKQEEEEPLESKPDVKYLFDDQSSFSLARDSYENMDSAQKSSRKLFIVKKIQKIFAWQPKPIKPGSKNEIKTLDGNALLIVLLETDNGVEYITTIMDTIINSDSQLIKNAARIKIIQETPASLVETLGKIMTSYPLPQKVWDCWRQCTKMFTQLREFLLEDGDIEEDETDETIKGIKSLASNLRETSTLNRWRNRHRGECLAILGKRIKDQETPTEKRESWKKQNKD